MYRVAAGRLSFRPTVHKLNIDGLTAAITQGVSGILVCHRLLQSLFRIGFDQAGSDGRLQIKQCDRAYQIGQNRAEDGYNTHRP